MKKFLVGAMLLSCFLFFGCKSGNTDSGDPKAVLSQFFEALSKKDMEAARKLATEESKSMIDMLDAGLKMEKDGKDTEKFDIKTMQFGEAMIEGDKATIPVKETRSGETLNYILKKEKGSWKVAFDKSSMMTMGMEKMNEKGINSSDTIRRAMEELKNLNLDSLKTEMQKGMRSMDSTNVEIKN